MNRGSDHFSKKLLSTFQREAEERIKALSLGLIELEKMLPAERQMEIIETVFREVHSVKGAARAVSAVKVETICQSLENVFSALKHKQITFSRGLFDLLHSAVDTLPRSLVSIDSEPSSTDRTLIEEITRGLESALGGAPPRHASSHTTEAEGRVLAGTKAGQPPSEGNPVLLETVRISSTKLDSLLLQAEELVSARLTAGQLSSELQEAKAALAAREKEWTRIYPEVRVIEQSQRRADGSNGQKRQEAHIPKVAEFLERDNALARSLEGRLAALAVLAERHRRSLGAMEDSLLQDMKKVVMLPFATLLEIFPKFIRDLSRDQGKEVDLLIQGGEIEIDKRILEEMKDPLIHLVRNCIDHGIEKPEERERKKKPVRGRLTIAIVPKDGNKVQILVSDDGAGIDLARVRAAASKLGMISQEEAAKIDEHQVLSFVFHSGISTSPIVTDISGRGLGLAIVREKVERLAGMIFLEARPDVGTTFRIVLPLTLARFRGIFVRVGEHLFVLPISNVERLVRASNEEIKTVENRETILLGEQALSLARLGDVLGLPRKRKTSAADGRVPVLIVGVAERRVAFQVDEVLGEQEVMVKSLGKQLARVQNVAGATVLGTGKVVLILNVSDLMKSAVTAASRSAKAAVAPNEEGAKPKSILVVEDSITARALLKNILESAGYNVKTAVDGIDAFTALKGEEFDLVISDVDMPRRNGFDLTATIRADKKLSELPVILVTALESREDRERGIDVGANAYIVKSSFDQSNLLEVTRRLV